jgi:hypothetical protein
VRFPPLGDDNDCDSDFGSDVEGKGKGSFKSEEAIDTSNGEAWQQSMFDHSNDISDSKNNVPVQRPLMVRCNIRKTLRLLESESADDDDDDDDDDLAATWTSRHARNALRMSSIQIKILIAKRMISKTCNQRSTL